jgi:hypothetical protein
MLIKERLEKHIEKEGECWLWTGVKDTDGYGICFYKGKAKRAHRVSFEVYKMVPTPGLVICHTCKNKHCIAPNHLEEGTLQKNMLDKWRDGTMPAGEKNYNAKLTQLQVIEIRNSNKSNKELSIDYNITAGYIASLKARRAWSWLK